MYTGRVQSRFMQVPCGRCIGCRLERKRQWAVRIMHEADMHDCNSFITLTESNTSLLHSFDGNCNATLSKKRLQDFWKRLRKLVPSAIRYFACGEYGSKRSRPHYHAAVFGFDFPDKVPYKTTDSGHKLYRSDMLDTCWSHGLCFIGSLTAESAAYVAGYIVDKRLGKDSIEYDELGIEPEFVVMSRGSKARGTRGIGASWFEKYAGDIYPADRVVTSDGKISRPPRYYDKLRAEEKPLEMVRLKGSRVNKAEENRENSTIPRLIARERAKLISTKLFSRPLH